MEIEFQGIYSWKDLVRAVFMASKPPLRKRLFRIVLGILGIGLCVVYFFVAAGQDQSTTKDALSIGRRILSFLLILFYFVYPYIATFITAVKLWRDPSLHGQTSGTISSEGIKYTGNKTIITWDRFAKKGVKSDLIVLLTANGILNFFPRDFFKSDADWQRAIQLINFKVVEAK